jgi:hypothetical protein
VAGNRGGLDLSCFATTAPCRTCPPHQIDIFENGKLKPGLYKIQNLVSKTYLDIHEHSMELCCRPASALEKDDGIVCTPCCFTFSLANPPFTVGSPAVRCWLHNSQGILEQHRALAGLLYLHDTVGAPRVCGETRLLLHRESWIDERSPICVSPFPVAWSIKVAEDEIYRALNTSGMYG